MLESDIIANLHKLVEYDINESEFKHIVSQVIVQVNELAKERDNYRESMIWGFCENEKPICIQGKEGELRNGELITAHDVNHLIDALLEIKK